MFLRATGRRSFQPPLDPVFFTFPSSSAGIFDGYNRLAGLMASGVVSLRYYAGNARRRRVCNKLVACAQIFSLRSIVILNSGRVYG